MVNNIMSETTQSSPAKVNGLFDNIMWSYICDKNFHLQHCDKCNITFYPPAPCCSKCFSDKLHWRPVSGKGKIISWAIFHRQYLPAYPSPYNVIAVRIAEGPIIISNLEGNTPDDSWINKQVDLVYKTMPDGLVIPRFKLAL